MTSFVEGGSNTVEFLRKGMKCSEVLLCSKNFHKLRKSSIMFEWFGTETLNSCVLT